jgi:hypothetical protein
VRDERRLSTTLHGRTLVLARLGWVAVVVVTVGLAAAGFVVGFHRPELIGQQTVLRAVTEAGIPIPVVLAVGLVLPMVAFSATGLFLFWRKSDDWMAMLFALMLVALGTFATRSLWALERAEPQLRSPVRVVSLAALALLVLLCCLFPMGSSYPAGPSSWRSRPSRCSPPSPIYPWPSCNYPTRWRESRPGGGD